MPSSSRILVAPAQRLTALYVPPTPLLPLVVAICHDFDWCCLWQGIDRTSNCRYNGDPGYLGCVVSFPVSSLRWHTSMATSKQGYFALPHQDSCICFKLHAFFLKQCWYHLQYHVASANPARLPASTCMHRYSTRSQRCSGLDVLTVFLSMQANVKSNLITATSAGSGLGCLLMGLGANLPLATAPGMGLNAYFAYNVVGYRGSGNVSSSFSIPARHL